ncbi:glycosyltransferase [Enteractinococcus helveticum]|uniref:glycosyltransferase n=1 Tax=Enteractinococcus helveticum TaxID=1837282 RepID=UPI0009EE023C|nr:glycosyltransferase [Enteractinococcus helveticum]
MNRRLLLVTHSYTPESTAPQRRWKKFLAGLASAGWDVEVLTPPADPRYVDPTQDGEPHLRIRRTPDVGFLPDSRGGRLAKAVVHAVTSVPLSVLSDADIVVATVPALPNLVAGRVIAWMKRVPFVVEMRDAWPDLIFESETGGKAFGTLVAETITRIQRSSDQLIAVTRGFAETLEQRNMPPVEVIFNSRQTDNIQLLPARDRNAGELNVLYLGNHGESQQLELLIEAASIARAQNPDIRIRFVGDGTQKPALQDLNDSLDNPVEMLEPTFGHETIEQYQWADTCMVSLRSDWASFAHTVPSKTYELLSYGKHITGVICGEAAEILRESGKHAVVQDNPQSLANTWLGLAQDPYSTPVQEAGPAWVAEHASDTAQIMKLDSVLKRKLPQKTTTNLLKRSSTAASISATAALEHLKNNRALFGLLVLRRLPQRLREPIATAASNFNGGPLDTVSAVGKAVLGRTDELKSQASSLLGKRGSDRKIIDYARVFIALGDLETAEWLLDRVRPNTRGLVAARAWVSWTRGDMEQAVELMKTAERERKTVERWSSELHSFQGAMPHLRSVDDYQPRNERVLHVLTNSLPHTPSGYAQRSHSIMLALQDLGWDLSAVTRIGWPITTGALLAESQDFVDGIAYQRLLPQQLETHFSERLQQNAEMLLQHVLWKRPALLHTTTHWTNAVVVQAVANAVGIPWVYEVRGQLADTWASTRDEDAIHSDYYRLFQAREKDATLAADGLVTLGEQMKANLVDFGADSESIVLSPNAVGGQFLQEPGDTTQARIDLGLDPELEYVGTVSSLVPYEGIETVVQAAAKIMPERPKLRLLIVGDGTALPNIVETARKLGIEDRVIAPGRVDRDESHLYHQALDIFVVPRISTKVTRMVTPMKSVEASASAKPVIASDLPALSELVHHEKTGLLVPAEDPAAWAAAIASLLDNPDLARQMGQAGRQWVLEERTWQANAKKYDELYRQILAR